MAEKKPTKKPTTDQKKAVRSLEGPLFVAAGAGSGKTGVVTRRFVHAIATGAAGIDEILTITFTRKAAAEMMDRSRDYMRHPEKTGIEYGEEEQARLEAACREIERARISTIDSFCSGVLRMSALAAGIDPEFATADEIQEAVLKQEAFDAALNQLLNEHEDAVANLIAAYDAGFDGRLFKTINGLYNKLRSWGLKPELPVPELPVPPDLSEARRRLREAVDEARAAVEREGVSGSRVDKCMEATDNILAALGESQASACFGLLAKGRPHMGVAQAVKDSFKAVEEQRQAFITALVGNEAARTKTVPMYARLLELFAGSYAGIKKERGVLDFADLAIMTRDLLKENESVRRRVASLYKLIMVDEFQDTSRVQYEIMELLARDNLMLVGDRNQSIYGFRDAEVELFQKEDERAEKEGYRVTLKANFRSQPEILAFIDHVFRRQGMLETRKYLKLEPAAPAEDDEDFRVELLLVDKAGREGDPESRNKAVTQPAEAELIARRLRELIDAGRYRPGDIAILFRTGSEVSDYREALEQAGIRTYFTLGAGYHARLELGDAASMLHLLVNPLDDMSLLAVLRSPFAGVTDDTLYHLRQASKTAAGHNKPLWPAVELAGELEEISAADRRRLTMFVEAFTDLRSRAARTPLAAIVRSVIDFNDYAVTMTAGTDGKQSLANLLKLVDLAAEFEETWGRNLALMTEFLSSQREAAGGENEAPMEKEGVDAVCVMTIHKAKGLEFPLVVLPRLHSKPGGGWGNNKPVFLVDREQKKLGLSYRDTNGLEGKIFDYEELEKKNDERELEEEKRLGYVAMTRAMKHLIIAGAAKVDEGPEGAVDKKQPLEWVRDILDVASAAGGAGSGAADALDENGCQNFTIEVVSGSPVSVRVCRDPFLLLAGVAPAGAGKEEEEVAPVSAEIATPLPPPRFVPHSISPTALDNFLACQRRYYLENVLDAGGIVEDEKSAGGAAAGTAAGGLSRSRMGTLVHAILERADLPPAGPPSDTEINAQAARVLDAGIELTDSNRKKAAELACNLTRAPVAPLLAEAAVAGELRREQDFAILVGETIVHGKIDALARADGAAIVVDYKTGNLSEDYSYEKAAAKYENQMAAYALAASRIYPGLPVRVVLVFLNHPELEHPREYQPEEIVKLEDSLAEAIASMAGGDFAPLPKLDKHLCYSCPGGPSNARLCPLAAAS